MLLVETIPFFSSSYSLGFREGRQNSVLIYVAIWRFTLYWTLLFYASSFALCGTYALLVRGLSKRRAPKLFVTVVLAFILTGTFFAVVGSAIVGM